MWNREISSCVQREQRVLCFVEGIEDGSNIGDSSSRRNLPFLAMGIILFLVGKVKCTKSKWSVYALNEVGFAFFYYCGFV